AAREDGAGNNIYNKNQAEKNQTCGPGLTMPVVIRRNGVGVNHHRERGGGLSPTGTPEAVAESGEEERSSFAGNASEGEQDGGDDAAIGSGHDDGSDGFPSAGAESHSAF